MPKFSLVAKVGEAIALIELIALWLLVLRPGVAAEPQSYVGIGVAGVLVYAVITLIQWKGWYRRVPYRVDLKDPLVRSVLTEVASLQKAGFLSFMLAGTIETLGRSDGSGKIVVVAWLVGGVGPIAILLWKLRRFRLED